MRLITTTALLTALAVSPALAQSTPDKPDRAAQAQTRPAPAGSLRFVEMQQPTEWSAEALIGRTVYSPKDEELGEINNVILSEEGAVTAVTIGAGGFLGLGEKNVGVPFAALEFRAEGAMARDGASANRATSTNQSSQQNRTGATGSAVDQAAKQDRMDATPGQPGQQPRGQAEFGARFDTEHDNVRIYLNATKDQLENAPEFKWLSDQDRSDPSGSRQR